MKYLTSILITAIITIPTNVAAQPKPEDQIKFRQSGMMFMRWNMGIIKKQVIKNPQSYNKQRVMDSADAIAAIANSRIDSLFTQESASGKGWKDTLVKPEYFYNTDKAKQYFNDFKSEANKLSTTARNGNPKQIKAQFAKLLNACKGCHKKFRNKK